MLGRLFAHEWKDTWKLMTILNGAVLALSLLGGAFAAMGDIDGIFRRDDFGNVWLFIMYMSFITVYILGIIVISIGTTLYFYIRFYRNMYTDQGYLMHTLPVTEHDLILSKALVALIWRVIGVIVMGVGILAILTALIGRAGNLFTEVIPDAHTLYRDFVEEMYDGNAGYFLMYVLVSLITGIGGLIYSVFMGYAAISLGQFAKKNKVIASVGIYFGIMIASSMISNMISQFFMLLVLRFDSDEMFVPGRFGALSIGTSFLMGIVVYAMSAAFYVITHRVMVKGLNLE